MSVADSVTFITGQLGLGGAEKQLYLLARGLQQAGWRVSVITLNPGQGDYWEQPLRDLNIPLYEIPHSNFRLGRLLCITNILRQAKPHIVHSWTLHANIYAALAGRLAGIPVRLGSERANQNTSRQALGNWWYYWSLRGLDGLVANSEPAAVYLRQHYPNLKVAVVANAIQVPAQSAGADEKQKCREYLGISSAATVVGAVGSLVPGKNFAMLIDVVASLAGEFPDLTLVLIGDGYLRGDLEQRARTVLPRGQFIFTGAIPNAAQWYPAFDLFCFPSNQEGMPNVLMEACAAGLPVVTTNVGGAPQIVQDGKTGFIVPVQDALAMRERIKQLIENVELRRQFGAAGREKMQCENGVEKMVREMMSAYRTTLGQNMS